MRKKTVNHIAITCFWYVLYFLPVISYLLYLFIHPGASSDISPIAFTSFCSDVGFTVVQDNIIYTSLQSIFGVNGILPFITVDSIYIILSWYIGVFLMHIMVDCLLFPIRWAFGYLKTYEKGDC